MSPPKDKKPELKTSLSNSTVFQERAPFELLKSDLHLASQISRAPFAATRSQPYLCLIMNMHQTELHLSAVGFKSKGNSTQ